MKPETEELVRQRLERARETLGAGDVLMDGGAYLDAGSRFYYAAFYAARALLTAEDLDPSTHSGAITLVQKYFVKTGRVDVETARALP